MIARCSGAQRPCPRCHADAAPYHIDRVGFLCSRCAARVLLKTDNECRAASRDHSLLVARIALAYASAARADRQWRICAQVARTHWHKTGRATARDAARVQKDNRNISLARGDALIRYARAMGLRVLAIREYAAREDISLSAARARARARNVLSCKNHRGAWIVFVPRQ